MTIPLGRSAYTHTNKSNNNPIWVEQVKVYLGGVSSARTCRIIVGDAQTATFSVAARADAIDVGYKAIDYKYSGTTAAAIDVGFNTTGQVYFGRWGNSTPPGLDSVWGQCDYIQVPTGPTSVAASSTVSGAVNVSWLAPTDNGGSSITGYIVHLSTTSNFAALVGNENVGSTIRSQNFTGLAVGATYHARVFAYNKISSDFTNFPSSISSQVVNATVIAPPIPIPVWSSVALNPTSVSVGGFYSSTAGVSATNTTSYSRVAGGASWLVLTSTTTGGISGTAPTTPGEYSVTIKATGDAGPSNSVDKTFSVTVNAVTPTWISAQSRPEATNGQYYETQVSASAGGADIVYSLVDRSNPWINVSPTGLISGTAQGAGVTTTITVRATSNSLTADRTFNVPVKSAVLPPVWVTSTLPAGKSGVLYNSSVSATNATSYVIFNKPAWITTFTAATGSFSGTPPTVTSITQYSFTVVPNNSGGDGPSRNFSISVSPPAPTWVTGKDKLVDKDGVININYSDGFSANFIRTGGYLITGLPTGLTYNTSTGAISGIPTQVGSFNISVSATGNDFSTITSTDTLQIYYPGQRITSVSPTVQATRVVNASKFNGTSWVRLGYLKKKTGIDGNGNDIWQDLSS